MPSISPLSIRSYGADGVSHRHSYAQLVLPVLGQLEIEIEGLGARLDKFCGALVAPEAWHAQLATGVNRFLIVDCELGELPESTRRQGRDAPFIALSPALRRLVEFVDLSRAADGSVPMDIAVHAMPLLLSGFAQESTCAASRLRRLCAQIESSLEQAWPLERMAQWAGVSVSTLHARFRKELGQSPQAWLSTVRLGWAREQLACGVLPIAQIAMLAGYSDQTALTRAMRRSLGITPGECRRLRLS